MASQRAPFKSHKLGEPEAVGSSDTNAVEERGFGGRAEKPIDHVAGLSKNRGQHRQPVIALSKPVPAPNMMGITAIRERDKNVRIDNDHKPRTLIPAEPVRQQLIDAFRKVRSPAVPDTDERRQPRGFLVVGSVLNKQIGRASCRERV